MYMYSRHTLPLSPSPLDDHFLLRTTSDYLQFPESRFLLAFVHFRLVYYYSIISLMRLCCKPHRPSIWHGFYAMIEVLAK